MRKPNIELRIYAKLRDVPLWAVAKKFGIADMTLFRWLNMDTTADFAQKFREAVDEIVKAG